VSCLKCRSKNQRRLPSEINVHFHGLDLLTKNVLAFPELVVCLDCGFTELILSDDEVRTVRELCSADSTETATDGPRLDRRRA
jgi:predicted nucleic-acid-binding Zn-ribbon protein